MAASALVLGRRGGRRRLSQALTVGPNTRLEFRRADDGGYVDVELPRADYVRLRDSLQLRNGSTVHLKPRRVTRFVADAAHTELLDDPAAAI